ncbi:response regulator transcription factor [Fructobacillus ficulneus]|uniref:OmpR family DNA-binding response regulator n=1 Tax=Fructobacillus ficulneus TaxID=157463 RepID=A0A0K8MJ11_9LACO|nr:response regulator transcription factor [Fructobacillus ficulneus]GAP00547.1 OmpR family DNA-binding response regulator [Fructobacillus ficulneus]
MQPTLLLVEDEDGLASSLKTEFEFEGFTVIRAKDGLEALEMFQSHPAINVIILDWMLPKLDGFSVLRKIRKTSDVQIIMLTARDYIGDRVAGLTGGADDYLTKPFEMEELLARVAIALRHGQPAPTVETGALLTVADLSVNTTTKRVSRGLDILPLTQREYELLVVLLTHQNDSCSRDFLLDSVWGIDFNGQPSILDVYVRSLRAKVDADSYGKKLIHTIRGVGYMLSDHVADW